VPEAKAITAPNYILPSNHKDDGSARTVGKLESIRAIGNKYGGFSVITTLEILQHHFSEMGQGNTSCDPHLHQTIEQPTLHYLTRIVCRRPAALCAGHDQQLGGASPLPNLMEVKG
jgi:hypothetical protein